MRTRYIGAVILLVVIAVVVGTATALAQPSPSPLEKREALEPGSSPRDRIPQAEALRQLARERGNVMVIVRMSLPEPFLGEGRLRAEDRGRQRAEIANVRRSLERELQQELRSGRAEIYRRFETIPALAMRVNPAAFEALLRSPLIEHIQEDEAVPYTLDNSTLVIGAPAVWTGGLTGAGQAVVILDTGIDGDHAFFRNASDQSRIVNAACFSHGPGEPNEESLCPKDENDDPILFGVAAAEADIPACVYESEEQVRQLCHHGSHVAGIAAGLTAGDLKGVAPDADIIPIQVFTRRNSGTLCSSFPCVLSYLSDQLDALEYVLEELHPAHTIASVNMSLGAGSNTTYCDDDIRKLAIDNLRSVGIATVIATGNNESRNAISTPSCISSAIAVSSTTNADLVSDFSNVHAIMDLFAPGSSIESAIVGENSYALFSGTSMATPHVAGAWAVLRQAAPTASVDQILEALVDTGFMVTDERDEDLVDRVTKPRIQLDDAVAAISPNTWTGADGNSWNHPGNWAGNSPPTCLQSVVIPASATPHPVLTADAEARDLEIAPNAAVDIGSHTLRLCGSLNTEAGGTLSGIGGTLHFDGTGTTTIAMPEGSRQLHHLRVGNGTDARTLVMSNPLQIAGNITVEEHSTLDSNGHELMFNGITQAFNLGPAPPTLVYSNGFDSTVWSYSDQNNDGTSWYISNTNASPNEPDSGFHGRYSKNPDGETGANDWFFSPTIALQAGIEYTIRFNYGASDQDFAESMAVWIGKTPSEIVFGPERTSLFDNDSIMNTTWTEGSGSFTPPDTNEYRIGFHARSEPNRRDLAMDDLRVETEGVHTFSRIHIAPNATLTLNSQSAMHILGDLEVEGTLRLNGTPMAVEGIVTNTGVLQDTLDVLTGPATTEFLHIRNPAGDALRYRGVEITPTGTALGTTSVEIHGHADCTQDPNDSLFKRCFDITPQNAHPANLRFWLSEAERNDQDASNAKVFRWSGAGWVEPSEPSEPSTNYVRSSTGVACDSVDGNQCWIQADEVSDYSPFVLGSGDTPTGSPDAPTAVVMGNVDLFEADVSGFLRGLGADTLDADRLLSLLQTWDPSAAALLEGADREAILAALRSYLDPDGDGRVAIFRWETLEEEGTVGFHVQRRQDGDEWRTINAGMLPAMFPAPMGAEYLLADPNARPGESYEYRLIEIEAWGTTREYGPYRLRMDADRPG